MKNGYGDFYEKNVIFGAGGYGMQALKKLGRERVFYFLDNDKEKQGTHFMEIPVISVADFLSMKTDFHVIIASLYARSMAKQL